MRAAAGNLFVITRLVTIFNTAKEREEHGCKPTQTVLLLNIIQKKQAA
jgi:hypothetical protein